LVDWIGDDYLISDYILVLEFINSTRDLYYEVYNWSAPTSPAEWERLNNKAIGFTLYPLVSFLTKAGFIGGDRCILHESHRQGCP